MWYRAHQFKYLKLVYVNQSPLSRIGEETKSLITSLSMFVERL